MITELFLSVFEISVSVSCIVFLLLLLKPFLNKRYAAKWKYWIWVFFAVRLILPFGGSSGKDVLSSFGKMMGTDAMQEEKNALFMDIVPSQRIIVEIPAQMTEPVVFGMEAVDRRHITFLDIVAGCWFMGCIGFLVFYIVVYMYDRRRILRKGVLIENGCVLKQLYKLTEELGVKDKITVIEYAEVGSPMVMGFFKTILVLPKESYSQEELFFILKHELIHLKRRDIWVKLLLLAARALHWINPVIWLMQKEAVIDMELSCDERVVWGAAYDVRKAYTETLFSMLHKKYMRGSMLSTQFYGGKQIMKERFKRILGKMGKKNGFFLFLCMVCFGMLVGCSAVKTYLPSKEVAEKESEDMTTVLSFYVEGELEEQSATLYVGDGYSIYIPDGEWEQYALDAWKSVQNEQVQFWVEYLDDKSMAQSEMQELEVSQGITFQAGKVEVEGGVWLVYAAYPSEAEEGWNRKLAVIIDTFAVSE